MAFDGINGKSLSGQLRIPLEDGTSFELHQYSGGEHVLVWPTELTSSAFMLIARSCVPGVKGDYWVFAAQDEEARRASYKGLTPDIVSATTSSAHTGMTLAWEVHETSHAVPYDGALAVAHPDLLPTLSTLNLLWGLTGSMAVRESLGEIMPAAKAFLPPHD